jgi:hypothetical protein
MTSVTGLSHQADHSMMRGINDRLSVNMRDFIACSETTIQIR